MSNKPIIRSYNDLVLEQERLRLELAQHKENITTQVQAIKQKLAPIGTIIGAVSGIAKAGADNPILRSGISLGVDMLIKNRLFKKSGLITGLIGSFLLRNVAGKVAAGAAGALIGKAMSMLNGRKKKEPKPE